MHYARVTGISNESTVKNVIIPPKYQFDFEEDVGFINSRAFAGTDIETIYIPNHSFLQVGSNVFDGCDSLTDVYVGYDPLIGVYWEDDWLGDAADHVTVHENVSLSEYKKLYYSGN